ncbi:putative ribonuclease H protein, partial [Trifolium medium]|nr:putative ribonuclease H protein [Trifolium medium]
MPNAISHNQSSFIQERSTTDNILTLQESIHSLNNTKGSRAYMILKIDLENAYDQIDWNAILDSMEKLHIPNNFKFLVKHNMESASMCIHWNGGRTNDFKPSR